MKYSCLKYAAVDPENYLSAARSSHLSIKKASKISRSHPQYSQSNVV